MFIGSSNIGADYGGSIYGNDSFIDLNIRATNICTQQTREMIENNILKHKQRKILFSKSQRMKKKMLNALKKIDILHDSPFISNNNYKILISKCGKKVEIQEDIFQNVILIRLSKLRKK